MMTGPAFVAPALSDIATWKEDAMPVHSSVVVFPPTSLGLPVPDRMGYVVGKDGSVWSGWVLRRDRTKPLPGPIVWRHLKTRVINQCGHLAVNLGHERWLVHRLVLFVYCGVCPDGMEARHLNGNPADNRLQNLVWGTRAENIADAVRHGVHPPAMEPKLNTEMVRGIRLLRKTGAMTLQEIGKLFGVSDSLVSMVANRRRYKDIE